LRCCKPRNDDGTTACLSVDITKRKDLILISESVDALDVAAKYRSVPVPLITFENDLLPDVGMTGLKPGVDIAALERHSSHTQRARRCMGSFWRPRDG
jgi:hypothetical protein